MPSWLRSPADYILKNVMSMKMLIHCAYKGWKRQVGATVLYVTFADGYNLKGACSLNLEISLLCLICQESDSAFEYIFSPQFLG